MSKTRIQVAKSSEVEMSSGCVPSMIVINGTLIYLSSNADQIKVVAFSLQEKTQLMEHDIPRVPKVEDMRYLEKLGALEEKQQKSCRFQLFIPAPKMTNCLGFGRRADQDRFRVLEVELIYNRFIYSNSVEMFSPYKFEIGRTVRSVPAAEVITKSGSDKKDEKLMRLKTERLKKDYQIKSDTNCESYVETDDFHILSFYGAPNIYILSKASRAYHMVGPDVSSAPRLMQSHARVE